MGSQFISPDTLLTDNQFGAFLQGGTVFENQASPKGAVLNSLYTPGSLVANYGDITFLQNNTPRNNLENKNYENVDILMTAGRIMFATAPFFPSEPYKLPGVEGGNTVANQQWGIDMTTSMGIQVPRHVDAMGNTVNFPFKLIRRLGPNTVQDHYLG